MTITRKLLLFMLGVLSFQRVEAQCEINAASQYCVLSSPIEIQPFPPGGTLTGPGVSAFTGSGFNFNPGASSVGTVSLDYSFTKKYYVDKSGPFAPEDILSSGTDVVFGNYDDGVSGALPIGFDFDFYGNTYSDFYLSTNGVLRFVSGAVNAFNVNLVLSGQSTFMAQTIAFLWDDWDNSPPQGTMKYETIGTAPNRILIVDFTNIAHYNNDLTKPANIQLKLFETTNVIEIHSTNSYTSSATQGIKGADNTEVIIPTDAYIDPDFGFTYYQERYNTSWSYEGYAINDFVAFIPHEDCSTSVDIEITAPPTTFAGDDIAVCYGEEVTLSGQGASSYTWNKGVEDGLAFVPTETTTYTLTGSENGCDVTDQVTVTVNPLPVIDIQASSVSICPGEEVVLEVVGEDTYEWEGGIVNGVGFIPTETATYIVVATTANNCMAIDEITVTVNPEPVVTASSTSTDINGGESVTLTGSGANTYEWDNGAVDGVSIIPIGTTTYSVIGSNEFGCTDTDEVTVIVNPVDQSITFGALADMQFGQSYTLEAVASSGLEVAYTSSDETVATINGDQVTIVGIGQFEITASQIGNGNYLEATPIVNTLNAIKADQVIQFNPENAKSFGDPDFNLTASVISNLPITFTSSNESVIQINGNTASIIGAGETTITASQNGDSFYNAAPNSTQTVIVNKASQTINFEALPEKTFGESAFELSSTSDAGLEVSFLSSDESVAVISGTTVTIVGAGVTTITASQSGNNNFESATDVEHTLTIHKANQTLSFDAIPVLGIGENYSLSAMASSGEMVDFSSSDETVATITNNELTILKFGEVIITASQNGNSNYNPAENVEHSLLVNTITGTLVDASRNTINVFPNPVVDLLNVNIDNSNIVSIVMRNAAGIVIFQKSVDTDNGSIKIDMTNFQKGLYSLQLKGSEYQKIIRILKL
ncbi:T9SS type A sorting domain-containing protein [Fulvivirga lutimaris]|uniref:T9SS type A sorting domain-containing protein n=1 Tax=Fulvivirga lutimaris TaxID=1819566 RepID=UPI0012BBAFAB|nr:T9SS type A sorting domain-containing protein [Fulvivirga lutimaris]MTI40897.1 T9SS type A sorting domain-containing protein [Fulvivirga lutimaris]